MDNILYIAGGLIILGFLIYRIIASKRDRRLKMLSRIRTSYGTIPEREYTLEELDKIKGYFKTIEKTDAFTIDDITWNDLDMDSIFAGMNHTFSSPGEEVLYALLRTPVFEKEELEERKRLIHLFAEDSELREALQMDFASIGRTKKYSLMEYLEHFRTKKTEPAATYIAHMLWIVAAITVIIVAPFYGILALIGVVGYNVFTYYREKGDIEPYYISLSAMAYMIQAAKTISAHPDPELSAYTKSLRRDLEKVQSLTKDMKWIGGASTVGSSADLVQIFMDYIRMLTHIDFLFFNKMVKLVKNNEEHITNMFRTIGYLEAMIAVASYREMLPFYTEGKVGEEEGKYIRVEDGYHPLLKNPVANSIDTSRPVLITGSNASGKSTFLRMCALSSLLSQTICTVHAKSYEGSYFRLYSSMALRDSIENNESYYIVEIKSIKRIMDALNGDTPVLCFVDEVLRGTNTVERIAASSQILKEFAKEGALVFAATHDIELTHLMLDYYDNYHFTERIEDGNVLFSYRLMNGRAESRNAIRLLETMGYREAVVRAAEAEAEAFIKEGTWQLV